MGGLGNGRRGGRSPPLMIGALIACILVLGFNYWVSSSRNLDLQTKLYELEGQVRRGVADRGVAEMKKNEYQEEIEKQKTQISNMEMILQRQLEDAQNICNQEKGVLQLNISSSTKTIQELRGQLNQINDDLLKLQSKLQSCQGNIETLNSKLMYDMTNCHSQVLSQKELCDERVAEAKLQVQKKMENFLPSQHIPPQQENALGETLKDNAHIITGADATVVSHIPSLSQPEEKDKPKVLTNDIIVGEVDPSAPEDLSKLQSQPVPSLAAVKKGMLPPPEGAINTQNDEAEARILLKNSLTQEKEVEMADAHEKVTQTEDPGMEGMLIDQEKAYESPGEKLDGTLVYDAEEQVIGGVDLEKAQQSKQAENIDKEMEEELADYNGDNENEGEFEADKQAELAQN